MQYSRAVTFSAFVSNTASGASPGFKYLRCTRPHFSQISSELIKLEKAKISLSVVEKEPKQFYFSFRAKEGFAVRDIAEKFGGGGHLYACAGKIVDQKATATSVAKLILKEMIQNGCYELSKYHLISNSLSIFVEYGDTRGDVSKGRVKMSSTTNSYSIIVQYALNLFDKIVNSTKFIRKIGYSFASLSSEQNEQYDLFIDIDNIKKEKQIVSSINLIKDKYGKNSLLKGLDLTEKATQQERNNSIGGHKSGEGKNAKN